MPRRALPMLAVMSTLAVTAAGCGGGGGGGDTGTSGSAATTTLATDGVISMKSLRFHPDKVQVKVGQKVTWRDDESIPHDVVADSGADFKSEVFGKGRTYSFTPSKPGTIAYECTLHPGMKGTLEVVQ